MTGEDCSCGSGLDVGESLASNLKSVIESAEGTKGVNKPTVSSHSGVTEVEVTGYGIDTPDGAGIVATTLMLSVKEEPDGSAEMFNRLVMVDTPRMRELAEELAQSFGGRVQFGPSHFNNPGDYIAAHLTFEDVADKYELENIMERTIELYERSIRKAT